MAMGVHIQHKDPTILVTIVIPEIVLVNLLVSTIARNSGNCNLIGHASGYNYMVTYYVLKFFQNTNCES